MSCKPSVTRIGHGWNGVNLPALGGIAIIHVHADRVRDVDRVRRNQVDGDRRAGIGAARSARAGVEIRARRAHDGRAAWVHGERDVRWGEAAGRGSHDSRRQVLRHGEGERPSAGVVDVESALRDARIAAVLGQEHSGRLRHQNRVGVEIPQRQMDHAGTGQRPGLRAVLRNHDFRQDALRQIHAPAKWPAYGDRTPAESKR